MKEVYNNEKRLWVILTPGFLLGFALLGVLFTRPTAAAPPQATATPVPKADSVAVFEEVTDVAGVAYTGAQFGVAWGDYDNDDWPDLFVSNHFHTDPNIYHNNGDGTFTDKTADLGARPPVAARDIHGASWGDPDNDGDLDLYWVTNGNSPNLFYQNQGGIIFFDQTVAAGIIDVKGRGRTTNWIDYNQDGALDLFVGNVESSAGPDKLYRNNRDGTFVDVSNFSHLNDTIDTLGQVWSDYDDDGDIDLVLTGGPVRLYRNNGDGTFTNAASAAGLDSANNNTSSADFGDYDNDGDLDLYVTRTGGSFFDHLTISSSIITYIFQSSDDIDGFDFRSSNSAVTFGMYQNDNASITVDNIFLGRNRVNPTGIPFTLGAATQHYGKPGLPRSGIYIWQDGPGGSWHVRVKNIRDAQGQLSTPGIFENVVGIEPYSFVNPPRPDKLYQNQGNGTFTEVGVAAGVASDGNSHVGTWGDYNNDGWLDLYVVNSGDVGVGDQPNLLYRNNGNGTFTDVAVEAGVRAMRPAMDDCAAWADYDRNGFLDLFIGNEEKSGYLAGPHQLFRNLGNGNHWLEIKLIGTISNRPGVGTKVVLSAGGITQTRYMNNGAHYYCQNSSVLHFGLGSTAVVDEITFTWPSGQQQMLKNVPADQLLTIVELMPRREITETPSETATIVHLPIILK